MNYFDVLEDPRKSKEKLHKLNDIIMCIFTILSNYKDSTEIAYFLKLRKNYFTKLLDLKYVTPSHDTISWVFRIINPNNFIQVFINWVKIKSNKITIITDLLDLINVKDCNITIDVIGTQKTIVDKIVNKKKTHYCLSIKPNHKSLFYDIDKYFKFTLNDKSELSKLSFYSSNKEHRRIEKRDCYVCNDVSFIND